MQVIKRILGALVFAACGAAAALCLSTATAVPINGGSGRIYGPSTVSAHNCITTDTYRATPGASGVTWYINSTRTATLTLYRVDEGGTSRAQSASYQSVTANVENQQITLYPLRRSRINICNTSGSSATISIDVDESK